MRNTGAKKTSPNFQIGKTWLCNHWATQMDEFWAWENEENHKTMEEKRPSNLATWVEGKNSP